MVDALTGYLTAKALEDKTADLVAETYVNDMMLHFGCPEVVVSDNGGEFRNNIVRAINHLLHIRHQFTVPYNPSSNGKVEKRNGTPTQMLTTFVQAHQQD
jgi:transposase InsO family protein